MRESSALSRILLVARLTFREATRRKIALAAVVMSLAFLALYGLALHFAAEDMRSMAESTNALNRMSQHIMEQQLLWMGLFPASFLVALASILIAVGSISGDIETNAIYGVLALPIRRVEIVLGKLLGLALMLCVFSLALNSLVLVLARSIIHSQFLPSWQAGLAILSIESLPLLALAVAGSTRLPTMANGVLCVAVYGVGFVGGLIESIGSMLGNDALVNTGIVSSLLMPLDVVHREAISRLMPTGLLFQNGGFGVAGPGQPSVSMMVYAVAYFVGFVAVAAYSFTRRDL